MFVWLPKLENVEKIQIENKKKHVQLFNYTHFSQVVICIINYQPEQKKEKATWKLIICFILKSFRFVEKWVYAPNSMIFRTEFDWNDSTG